jgi:O-antigen ligase
MIKENFFIGVGLNNFIPNLVRYSGSFINSWELQPVHNIFLLVFSETGVVGFLAFIVLLFASLTTYHYALISILITGMADHYWLTLQQNMLLFTYVVALSTIRK